MKRPRKHIAVLTDEQLDVVTDGLEEIAKRVDWSKTIAHTTTDKARFDAVRNVAGDTRYVLREHLYSTNGAAPAACERNGCPHIMEGLLERPDDSEDDDVMPPVEYLIKHVIEMAGAVEKVVSDAKWKTRDMHFDGKIVGTEVQGDVDTEQVYALFRGSGMNERNVPHSVVLVERMTLFNLVSAANAMRRALRYVRREQQRTAGILQGPSQDSSGTV